MKINYARKRNYPTGPTHCKTVEGYTNEMLAGAISSLARSPLAVKSGSWECERLKVIKAERQRREVKP